MSDPAGLYIGNDPEEEARRALYASLQAKAGVQASPVAPVPQDAPPVAPAPAQTPPAPAPAAATGAGLGLDPNVMNHLRGLLGPEFDPEKFKQAQEADWWKTKRNEMVGAGQRIAAAMGNVPYERQDPTSTLEQTMLANRRSNLLGTTEAAGKLQGMLLQQTLMDPNSPMSRAKQQQLLTMDPDYVAKRYGGPEGIKNMPGFLIAQDLEARGHLAGVQKTGAETANLQAETTAKPQAIAQKWRELDQGYELKKQELAQAISEGDKTRANAIEKTMLELENTRAMFQAQNPRVVTDKYVYVGPGVPPPELRTSFNTKVQAPTLETARKIDEYLAEFDRLKARGGLSLVDPVEMARMRSLSEQITAALARRNAAGNSPSQSEIELAKLTVPEPNLWKDTSFPDRLRRAATQTRSDIMADMDSQARGAQLAPIPEGMSPRDAEGGMGGSVQTPSITMKTPGGQLVSVPPDKVQEAIHAWKFVPVPRK